MPEAGSSATPSKAQNSDRGDDLPLPRQNVHRRAVKNSPTHLLRRLRLVIGGRDMDAGAASVRLHSKGPQGAKPKGEVVAEILAEIRERRA